MSIRGSSLPLRLGLFEEVLPPFCLIQEYICLWGQGRDVTINDLDLGLVSKISKFADDTKMGINADSDAAVKQLQEDLRKVGEWSKKWQMRFNLDKCKIMHIGHKNKNEKYELLGKEIESVQQEKDLGVVITNDLKSSNQCIEAVKEAQKLLGYIKRQFRTRNKETILTLYNALVRPHLEYAVQFCHLP